MTLVDDHHVVGREVVEQRPRARAGRALVEVAAVVLDAGRETHLAQHLQVVHDPLLDTLRFQETLLVLVEGDAFGQFRFDVVDGSAQLLLVGDELARGIDGDASVFQQHFAGQRLELGDAFNGIAPELDQVGCLGVGGVDLERVAADAEGTAPQLHVVAVVVDVYQVAQQGVAAVLPAALQVDNDVAPRLRVADTIDARHRGNDDDVLAAFQRGHGLQSKAVKLFVDLRLFFDEEVVARNVGLRLVVVVVADEVRDGVMGEEVAELRVELGSQRLVVGQDEGRPLCLLDNVGDGERLARARRAQQRLELVAAIHPGHQPFDGHRLVARCREVRYQLKVRHSTP